MKKLLYTILILILFGLFGFFVVAGKIVDGQMNVLERHDYGTPSADVKALHDSLIIADWHSDNLLWDRDIFQELTHGHVDIPRLRKGNFTLQVFDAVIKTPKGQNYERNSGDTDNITMLAMANRWPRRTWSSLCERALYQSERLHRASTRSNCTLRIIKSQNDLDSLLDLRTSNKDIIGGLLSIEGLHALEGQIDNLDTLYNAGYRMMGLTHFFDNEVGGSSAGVVQGGLTTLGRQVIQKMDKKNIIIDLAHASPKLISDVLALTHRPVVVSHTGVRGTYDSPRNLSDDQLKAIAQNGGIVGIGFWEGAIGNTHPTTIVKTIKYVIDLIGIDHVSLGSDWDGGTTTYFDAAHIWVLTEALMDAGLSNQEIFKIMGGNQIEFLKKNLPLN